MVDNPWQYFAFMGWSLAIAASIAYIDPFLGDHPRLKGFLRFIGSAFGIFFWIMGFMLYAAITGAHLEPSSNDPWFPRG